MSKLNFSCRYSLAQQHVHCCHGTNNNFLDLTRGLLYSVITHEIAHVLGIGTLWGEAGLVGSAAENCFYSGDKATAEFRAIGGCDSIPIDMTDGPEAVCAHWSEACLETELMTPFINRDASNPFSRISIASLEDLGYAVDYKTADPYTENNLNATIPGCVCNPRSRLLRDSVGSHHAPQEKVSDELRQYAVQNGLALLEKADAFALEGRGIGIGSDHAKFMGNKVISMVVEERGQVFIVLVQKES